jgi:hypothetical protein
MVPPTINSGPCRIRGCRSLSSRKGWCQKHYTRWRRHGDPLKTARAISNGGITPSFKKQWVIEYKLSRGCADCGYNEHHAALDFDHRPGTRKVRDIKSGQQLGWDALQDEVAKCDVVCANCHRIRTFRRREVVSHEYVVH